MLNEHDPVVAELNRHLQGIDDHDDARTKFEAWLEGRSWEELSRMVHGDAWLDRMEDICNEAYNGYGARVVEMAHNLARGAYDVHLRKEAKDATRERFERIQEARYW